MTPLDFTKPVTTRDGHPVEIITSKGRGIQPIVGYIADGRSLSYWYQCGQYNQLGNFRSETDLIQASERKTVPLGPEDVPPGSVFRRVVPVPESAVWAQTLGVFKDGIKLTCADNFVQLIRWGRLMTDNEILRPGETEWKPCHRTVEAAP